MPKDKEGLERERKLTIQRIKKMVNEYFNAQDNFLTKLIEAYHKGFFSGKEYKPYFDWKITKVNNITKDDAQKLLNKVREDLEPLYDSNDDSLLLTYLEAIEAEITKIIVNGLYIQ
jgi:hypothetical protein